MNNKQQIGHNMKLKMLATISLLALTAHGCKASEDPELGTPVQAIPFDMPYVDNTNQNKPTHQVNLITKTPELIAELKAQPTINDQFNVLYNKFEPLLDRSKNLIGTDSNKDGIRDDIESFINTLEVTEPVRNVLKQDARSQQEHLYYDFYSETDGYSNKAVGISNKYEKVMACYQFVGVDIDDFIDVSRKLEALTHNTKARTLAYIRYNHLLDGSVSTSLKAEEKYCE